MELVSHKTYTVSICTVNHKNYSVYCLKVVFPGRSQLFLARQVPHLDFDVFYLKLFKVISNGRYGLDIIRRLCQLIELHLVQDGGFPCRIETDHDELEFEVGLDQKHIQERGNHMTHVFN